MSVFGIREMLAIAVDDADLRHAIYPTAARTLCGETDTIVDVVAGDEQGEGPDCLVCAVAARLVDEIDRSAPAAWFRGAFAA